MLMAANSRRRIPAPCVLHVMKQIDFTALNLAGNDFPRTALPEPVVATVQPEQALQFQPDAEQPLDPPIDPDDGDLRLLQLGADLGQQTLDDPLCLAPLPFDTRAQRFVPRRLQILEREFFEDAL